MIDPLEGLPPGVIGFDAVGEVEASDYTGVLVPAVGAAAEQGPIRLVFVMGDRFDGYSTGAAWQDAKVGLEHHSKWRRMALVTDVGWVTHVARLFGWMIPGDFELFPLADRDAAITWAAAG